jgi:putative integral membrane protein (TIGR02587 family)
VAGALIFSLPMLMTAEMWQIGFSIDPWRLALLLVLLVPLLAALSAFGGFKDSTGLLDDVIDAFVAIAVAALVAVTILLLFSQIEAGMSAQELIGKIVIQVVPGSIGAMLARSQLSADDASKEERKRHPGYLGELFLMAAGALFLSLNVAPTEEVVLISYAMTTWQEVVLALVSLLVIHAFVYAIDIRGQHQRQDWESVGGVFLRFAVVGYVIVLAVCFYLLWTFGRTQGVPFDAALSATVVLAFPGAVGAAAARLIL